MLKPCLGTQSQKLGQRGGHGSQGRWGGALGSHVTIFPTAKINRGEIVRAFAMIWIQEEEETLVKHQELWLFFVQRLPHGKLTLLWLWIALRSTHRLLKGSWEADDGQVCHRWSIVKWHSLKPVGAKTIARGKFRSFYIFIYTQDKFRFIFAQVASNGL